MSRDGRGLGGAREDGVVKDPRGELVDGGHDLVLVDHERQIPDRLVTHRVVRVDVGQVVQDNRNILLHSSRIHSVRRTGRTRRTDRRRLRRKRRP